MTAWLRQILLPVMLGAALPNLVFAANQAPASNSAGVAIIGPSGTAITLNPVQILALPAITVNAAFETEHGPFKAVFSGPLLWTILGATSSINPKAPKLLLREFALVTGSDGYSALLALAEIAPEFEDKNVILATKMNGKYLGARHFRIVVPGDRKGGRSVRDVVRIAVSISGSPKP